jgi:simple sugar transport system ATP-binding protein
MRHLGPAGFVKRAFRNERASRLMKELEVVAASGKQPVSELSGGNQQKVVFGRCFASNPRVLVLVNPTSGVDVASKGSLFGAIQRSCAAGAAVLIVSDDLDELRDCLEVLVMFRGRITARFGEARRDQDLIAAIEGGGVDGLA